MNLKKIILSLCFLFCLISAQVFADDSDVILSMQINQPMMQQNGVEVEIDAGRGTTPVIRNDRTLVPIRAIIEAFGGNVKWEEDEQSVYLTLEDDTVRLNIDSHVAYKNGEAYTLDVAPAIIHERTMLPIRFIAESFYLGVAWDSQTKTVSVIRNRLDDAEYQNLIKMIPEYQGNPSVTINQNQPFWKPYEILSASFEYYSKLDELGRCDVCMASVSEDLMPTEERESISSVKPTGWVNASYDSISGGYLYNRSHLIGYQLTGENANERNLITGTRYLNVEGMLPFENMIDDYVEATGNHVMYRATPLFYDNNLLADGVLLEAYSVEDNGEGISFCVYCYNVQPGISIDYKTGISRQKDATEKQEPELQMVYRTPTGKKYHFQEECGGKNSKAISLKEAQTIGLTPCNKCAQ